MFRLLNIEFHKLKHSKASKVLIITYFILLTSTALIATINFDFAQVQFHLAEMGVFNFPYIWHLSTYLSSAIKFFLLLVIVSMMANEYSNKTLKQNLIDGLSKKEFVLSKFYTVIIFSLASTIFVFFVSLILGLIYSDFTEIAVIFSDLEYMLAFFIKLVGFFSFGLFLGILIKRSAFAIGAMIMWFMFESFIKGMLHWKLKGSVDFIMQFLPLESMSNLIKEPFTRFSAVKSIAKQIGEDLSKDYTVHFFNIIIVIVWTIIFVYLSYWLLKQRDL
jgi:ABC-type transport system involved in multi-copper enzyme maturation permease subunit|tara:strand:- start:23185 stop:24012 length:828 start_codon:yes stop_codon:yes gene_type:complete